MLTIIRHEISDTWTMTKRTAALCASAAAYIL